jgi:tryptophanyl-tRNA synthetase
MAADILIFHGARVPIGEDQLSHLELVRELARRFNRTFGDFFVEPEAVLSRVPRLVGTDGRAKMSKSLDNAIYLSDDPSTVARRVRAMYTDPRRVHSDVPGIVEGNPVFDYHDAFNPDSLEVADLKARYRAGKVGDVEVKERLTLALNRFLDPIRARRRVFEADRDGIRDLLRDGTRRARMLADATLRQVRRRIGTLVLNVDGERS